MEEITLEESGHQELAESDLIDLESFYSSSPPPRVINELKSILPEEIKWSDDCKKYYEPTSISLGPVFYNTPECRPMENFKKRYAASFIRRCGIRKEDLTKLSSTSEDFLRKQYRKEDSTKLSSKEFVMMMLTDGCFLIEFLLRLHDGEYEEKDRMSHKKWININSDLLLLSNQIPLDLLSKLMSVGKFNKVSIDELIKNFLSETLPYYAKGNFDGNPGHHLLDCLLNLMKPEIRIRKETKFPFGRQKKSDGEERKNSRNLSLPTCPTISQLHRAGVKFRLISSSRSSSSPWDLRFRRGVLEIPPLNIDDITAKLYANLVALEALKGQDYYVTDYVAMMYYLIENPEDVKILVQNGIIEDEEGVSYLINDLGKNIDVSDDFYFSDIVEDLKAYCKLEWIRLKIALLYDWKMDLKRNYFSNPWKALSVVAAVILLGLTIIQTVFSYLQLK